MPIEQSSRWDAVGVEPPDGAAKYVAGEQPIAEYDNWFNRAVVEDIAALIVDALKITERWGEFVLTGLLVHESATPGMSVVVDPGIAYVDEKRAVVEAATTLAVPDADATYDRIDIVVIYGDGTLEYIAGTPAATPAEPATPAGAYKLASVYVAAGATAIYNTNITDTRKLALTAVLDIDMNGKAITNAALPCIFNLNKGSDTAATVTETTETLKQEITADKNYIYLVESIHVLATNPTGSGATLYFTLKALLDDGSEVNLLSAAESVAEGGSFDDTLINVMDAIPNDAKISAIRLYAYCDLAPVAGYEPTVQLEKVTGVQN
ncbi:hypothetical protein DRP04_11195 [Archaeoglobales archaeon]|nr:MAG: hypothetical protein DRP04_11195 [Archaeoglobales archaeon]